MLRPVTLLPPWRLSTPRFGSGALAPHRRPATGRSGAYPDGTCTRWMLAARNRAPSRLRARERDFLRTHHGSRVTRFDLYFASRRTRWL